MSIIDAWGYSQFCSFSMLNKEDIMNRIERERSALADKLKTEENTAIQSRYGIIDRMFASLYADVEESNLFALPEWDPKADPAGVWRYQLILRPLGMKLQMAFVDGFLDNQNEYGYCFDETNYLPDAKCFNVTDVYDVYDLIEERSKLLTVEEYAKQNNVQVVTVRQWIRRGKLRSAIKMGGEWRIPELTSIPNQSRGYRTVYYSLKAPMNQFIEGFEDINEYDMITIEKGCENYYDISLKSSANNQKRYVTIDTARREKFELYLISSGNAVCYDNNEEILGYE